MQGGLEGDGLGQIWGGRRLGRLDTNGLCVECGLNADVGMSAEALDLALVGGRTGS